MPPKVPNKIKKKTQMENRWKKRKEKGKVQCFMITLSRAS